MDMLLRIIERLNTLNIKSHYFLFGGGSYYPLRVAPDVKTFGAGNLSKNI